MRSNPLFYSIGIVFRSLRAGEREQGFGNVQGSKIIQMNGVSAEEEQVRFRLTVGSGIKDIG